MTLQDIIKANVEIEKISFDRAKFGEKALELYDWFVSLKSSYFADRSFNEFVTIVLNTIVGDVFFETFEDWGCLNVQYNTAASADVMLALNCQVLTDVASVDVIKSAFMNSPLVP